MRQLLCRTSSFLLKVLLTTLMSISVTEFAHADSGGPFGLGIVLGEPTAITGKYRLDERRAIDGGVAFNLDKWFLVYSDWTYHFNGAFGKRTNFTANLAPYAGIGGLVVLSNKSEAETRRERYFDDNSSSKTALGVRIPLGIEWTPGPIGVFIELAPGMTILPATDGFVQGGIGVRFFF